MSRGCLVPKKQVKRLGNTEFNKDFKQSQPYAPIFGPFPAIFTDFLHPLMS